MAQLIQSYVTIASRAREHTFNFKVFRGEVFAVEGSEAMNVFHFKLGYSEWSPFS